MMGIMKRRAERPGEKFNLIKNYTVFCIRIFFCGVMMREYACDWVCLHGMDFI